MLVKVKAATLEYHDKRARLRVAQGGSIIDLMHREECELMLRNGLVERHDPYSGAATNKAKPTPAEEAEIERGTIVTFKHKGDDECGEVVKVTKKTVQVRIDGHDELITVKREDLIEVVA